MSGKALTNVCADAKIKCMPKIQHASVAESLVLKACPKKYHGSLVFWITSPPTMPIFTNMHLPDRVVDEKCKSRRNGCQPTVTYTCF